MSDAPAGLAAPPDGHLWAVSTPVRANPFGGYLARAFAGASAPDDMLEAARTGGAGEARTLFTLGLAMMRDGLIIIVLLPSVAIWNYVVLPLMMLTDPTLFPMNLGIFQWSTT
ncbi:hypothetical protein [Streptomyces alfalfae]|uniref:hypothetical protein n=1 Tax=Streptomyces alfalfae TaxID=1642299 RepID=UPI0010116F5F|nr:hypothetical protein [Streptomyces alfalfae]